VTLGVAGSVRTRFTPFELPLVIDAPVWNGSRLLVAGWDDPDQVSLSEFVVDEPPVAWRRFGAAITLQAIWDPSSGTTALFYRDAAGVLRVETFAEDGRALAPIGGTPLEPLDVFPELDFDYLEDGTGQPWVLAAFTIEDGTYRALVRRFRPDGSAAGGFSTPLAGIAGRIDLTTVAPAGHRTGYGMIAGSLEAGAVFHGAGEDFVGDGRAVPLPCDGASVGIASGPCGYVLACTGGGAIHTALAIPPRPR
jgi:hypothetical protein